jgi:hypothetical protein
MADTDSDFFAVIDRINRTGAPDTVAKAYHNHLRDLYWKTHDLPGVVAIGRAGILYCLAHALRPQAKAMAYDVGSFTWPGWEEPGINPTTDDLAFGRQCAGLNLSLAIELNKPVEKVASAHWLAGAHALTAGEWSSAASAFDAAIALLETDSPFAIYLRGCAAVAKMRADDNPKVAHTQLQDVMSKLQNAGDNDSAVYLGQIKSILKLYGPATS